ncbi:hypothetical protein PORCRE_1886 [Porphyromonas crevioricanis JCM 15906]|nr:hypothetical protein PORCRE_1886 [Porphyromonas crevioricanis JCM 15906]GAD08563.1 hypothetical protein PORCAN_2211 [Porphyromonas crevioricanis JCM 13913]
MKEWYNIEQQNHNESRHHLDDREQLLDTIREKGECGA